MLLRCLMRVPTYKGILLRPDGGGGWPNSRQHFIINQIFCPFGSLIGLFYSPGNGPIS